MYDDIKAQGGLHLNFLQVTVSSCISFIYGKNQEQAIRNFI